MEDQISAAARELDRRLLERHGTDRELFAKLDRAQIELGVTSGSRPISPFLRPQLMSRERYDRIVRAAEILFGAFEKMARAALTEPAIMAELALTEREERYARIDPGYPEVCNTSRLDAFLNGDEFKFLEYNGETPAGITDQIQIEKVLSKIPAVQAFLREHPVWLARPHRRLLEALIGAYRDFGGQKEKPTIAIVDWKGVSTSAEFDVLKEYFELEGHKTLITEPDKFEYDGDKLTAGGIEIDIFYKRVVIHEFLDRCTDDDPFFKAYRDGNICMANSFRAKIPHKKASFAVLQDERWAGLFTSEEHEMIRRHLPWTRRVREGMTAFNGNSADLIELLRRSREKFLLKPNDDYGGSGIIVGWESTESEWDAAIGHALGEPFVVQERADVEKVEFPMYNGERAEMQELLIDFDPFLFRGRGEGGLVRLSPQSLVNVAAGGGEAALAVMEPSGR
ncbi:MAG TPA: hypothetical protein VK918_04405 [Pyrinomonadaceae bacterium]|nr:hypothetical protein [Pyrinomonadaceae bacterium]